MQCSIEPHAVAKVDVELEVEGTAVFRAFNFEAGFAIEHIPNLAESRESSSRA
jgi:hypothetical protein